MNKIQSTIAATFVTVSLVTAAYAADAAKPVVPAPPIVASQPSADAGKPVVPAPPVVVAQPSAVDAAAKNRADKLRERNRKAKALSGSGKKAVAAPAAPVTGSATAKKAEKLNDKNTKDREKSQTLNSNLPKAAVPAAPSTVK